MFILFILVNDRSNDHINMYNYTFHSDKAQILGWKLSHVVFRNLV